LRGKGFELDHALILEETSQFHAQPVWFGEHHPVVHSHNGVTSGD
jgi:hypothetical protein